MHALEEELNELIKEDVPISYVDENCILIGDETHKCTGPRMHVRSAGEIEKITLLKELLKEPITERYLLVGVVGEIDNLNDLNHIVL